MPDYEPLPGENRLLLVTTGVFVAIGVIAIVVGIFVPNLLVGAVVILVVSVLGFVYALSARRNYLRDVATGKVVERERWSGPDVY